MNKEIKGFIDKAKRSLKAAKEMFNGNYFEFATSRGYYAMFYAAEAVLLSQKLSFSKHSGVISAFGQYFVKTGIFPKELHNWFRTAFDKRNIGDYSSDVSINSKEAKEVLDQAEKFINTIERYLGEKRFL